MNLMLNTLQKLTIIVWFIFAMFYVAVFHCSCTTLMKTVNKDVFNYKKHLCEQGINKF